MALLPVLIVTLLIWLSSTSFVSDMNQQQARAGARLRWTAAMSTAAAGVHRALSILESINPDNAAPHRHWRPVAYSESLAVGATQGRFTLSLRDDADGAILITSAGEFDGVVRRLRARVYLAPPALLAALYGTGVIRLERPPAGTLIVPYGAGLGDRRWVHIAAGRGVWFASSDVSVNRPERHAQLVPGPVDPPVSVVGVTASPTQEPARLLLARGADLMVGDRRWTADPAQLRAAGVHLDREVRWIDQFPPPPMIDREFYRALASRNVMNAEVNHAAGRAVGDSELLRKKDSLYTQSQMAAVLNSLASVDQPLHLRGAIYVSGETIVPPRTQVYIADGALISERTVMLRDGAHLSITHTPSTRTLPGIIVVTRGALVIAKDARLRVHGLTYTDWMFDAGDGASVEVVGALASKDFVFSYRNKGATIIRYDPAVLGTVGLRQNPGDRVIAWIAGWEELVP